MEFTASTKNSNTYCECCVDIRYCCQACNQVFYLVILAGLQQASIGFTHTYSRHLFLCTLSIHNTMFCFSLTSYFPHNTKHVYCQLRQDVLKQNVLKQNVLFLLFVFVICFCYLFLLFVSLKATVGFLGPNSEHVYCLTHQESLHVWKVSEVSAKYMSILGSSTIEDNHSYITDKLFTMGIRGSCV